MTTPMSSSELTESLTVFTVKPGVAFTVGNLRSMLTEVETALFFAKLYKLDAREVGRLLALLFNTDLTRALFTEGRTHSNELQDYLIELSDFVPQEIRAEYGLKFHSAPPKGEILPEVWKMVELTIADSIQQVADKLGSTVGLLPGKKGEMVFKSLMTVNAKRPVLGTYKANIHHKRQQENLLILDVSGSMTENTIRTIVDDVVALSYMANAHLAIVSNTVTYWEPGTYSSDSVLKAAEFCGTHYEELAPLFDRDWGVVITVADYDSVWEARSVIAACPGRIGKVLDVSLVDQPTFLASCVGQLAQEVEPILIGSSSHVLQ